MLAALGVPAWLILHLAVGAHRQAWERPEPAELSAPASGVQITVDVETLDGPSIAQALEVRMGEAVQGWRFSVWGTEVVGAVVVEMEPPGEAAQRREIVLTGRTVEARSRELAAALTLLVEQHRPPPPERDDTPPPRPAPTPSEPERFGYRGWLGAGARLALGPVSSPDIDAGVDLIGGSWLLREHLQPLVQVAWARSRDGSLRVDAMRFGAGLAAGGAPRHGVVWVGVGGIARAAAVRSRDRAAETVWVSSHELFAMAQLRPVGRLVIGLRTGVDLGLPPLSIQGQTGRIRYGIVRWMAGLSVAVGLGHH